MSELHVLFYFDDDAWIAQCLQYDLAAHGGKIEEAWDALEEVLKDQVLAAVSSGADRDDPLAALPPAPLRVREMAKHAYKMEESRVIEIPLPDEDHAARPRFAPVRSAEWRISA